jgi:hypothetical protein
MIGFIKKIFGSDSVISAGISGIDKIVFTDEEKSDAKMKLLKLYEPFKLAQRYLALIFSSTYCLAWFTAFLIEVIDVFIEKNLDTSVLYDLLTKSDIPFIVALIVGFYFGGGLAEGAIKQMKKK